MPKLSAYIVTKRKIMYDMEFNEINYISLKIRGMTKYKKKLSNVPKAKHKLIECSMNEMFIITTRKRKRYTLVS